MQRDFVGHAVTGSSLPATRRGGARLFIAGVLASLPKAMGWGSPFFSQDKIPLTHAHRAAPENQRSLHPPVRRRIDVNRMPPLPSFERESRIVYSL